MRINRDVTHCALCSAHPYAIIGRSFAYEEHMATLTLLHARLLTTILLFFGALAIWGFFNYLRGQGVTGGYKGALAIGELLMIAEMLLGVILFIGGERPF